MTPYGDIGMGNFSLGNRLFPDSTHIANLMLHMYLTGTNESDGFRNEAISGAAKYSFGGLLSKTDSEEFKVHYFLAQDLFLL